MSDIKYYEGTHNCYDIDYNIDEVCLARTDGNDLEHPNLKERLDRNIGSLQEQINQIVSPVTQDAEVQNARVGVDSTVYTTLKDRLDSEFGILDKDINNISEKTRNEFSVDGLLIGCNNSGKSGFPTRAISGAIHKTGSAITVSTKKLPSNLKYNLVGYTDENFSSPSSCFSDWISDESEVSTTTTNKSYIRVLFGSVNNAALTEQDFYGLEMQIENSASSTEYIPNITAVDYVSRETSNEIVNDFNDKISDISETTRNEFSVKSVTIGINQAGQANAKSALTESFHRAGSAITVSTKTLPSNLQYRVIGYSNAEYGGATNISGDAVTDVKKVTTVSTKEYIRIVFSNRDDSDFKESDLNGLEMQIEDGAAATDYVPNITAVDYIARNVQKAAGSNPVHVKVMTYNVGAYTYGTGGTIDESIVVPQCKTFFNDEDCDILGLEENKTTLDTHTSDEAIYDYLYPYKINATNLTAIKSRYALSDTGSGTFAVSDRTYVYGTTYIGGKEVFIMCVHLSPSSAETREQEYSELFEILADHETFIVFGDFNASKGSAQSEFNLVLNEGYKVANGGYLGLINTYGDHTEYLDNIITSSDITIAKTYVPDVYSSMPSDHLPLICDLVIYP